MQATASSTPKFYGTIKILAVGSVQGLVHLYLHESVKFMNMYAFIIYLVLLVPLTIPSDAKRHLGETIQRLITDRIFPIVFKDILNDILSVDQS